MHFSHCASRPVFLDMMRSTSFLCLRLAWSPSTLSEYFIVFSREGFIGVFLILQEGNPDRIVAVLETTLQLQTTLQTPSFVAFRSSSLYNSRHFDSLQFTSLLSSTSYDLVYGTSPRCHRHRPARLFKCPFSVTALLPSFSHNIDNHQATNLAPLQHHISSQRHLYNSISR